MTSPQTTPWKLLVGSAAGTSHSRRGEGCQDYGHAVVVDSAAGPVLLAACADGAGSVKRSADGAKLACLWFVHRAAEALRDGRRPADLTGADLLAWYDEARRRISLEACLSGLPLREFACTLLTAVVSETAGLFGQIGDGAIVFRDGDGDGDGYRTAGWPQTGEYANTTYFLTESRYERQLAVHRHDGPITDVALLSDGLQPLALHYATRSVHGPFFEPMFRALKRAESSAGLEGPLRAFLDSKAVNERTDDDKTLILATR